MAEEYEYPTITLKIVSQRGTCAYGHKVGHSIGMFYLENPVGITNEWIRKGTYEIGIEGKKFSISVHLRAPYDPKAERVKL